MKNEILKILNTHLETLLGQSYVLLKHGSSYLNSDIDVISDFDLVLAVEYQKLVQIAAKEAKNGPNLETIKYKFFFEIFAKRLKDEFEKQNLMIFEIDQAKVPLLNIFYK